MQETHAHKAIRWFIFALEEYERQQGNRATLEEIVEAMARTNITAAGVAEVIRMVHIEGIASTSTSPNPADYNRPLILVHLNREHPVVRAVLAGEPIPRKEPRTERPKRKFPIGRIEGELLSETIIRERR